MREALIVWGGWDGHEPDKVAALFADWLREAWTMTEQAARYGRQRQDGRQMGRAL